MLLLLLVYLHSCWAVMAFYAIVSNDFSLKRIIGLSLLWPVTLIRYILGGE